jgi:hypothetical protein
MTGSPPTKPGSGSTDTSGESTGRCSYPGATLVADSPIARDWATAVGIDFHKVRIETDAHDLTLVFSDLRVENLSSEPQG